MKSNRQYFRPHLVISVIAIILSTFGAFAVENIEGAFGQKLGEVFDPGKAIGTNILKDKISYEFISTNGYPAFNRYFVSITPASHKIYEIEGWGTYDSAEEGKRQQTVLMDILEKKYGPQGDTGMSGMLLNMQSIRQDNRQVFTTTRYRDTGRITIHYVDRNLSNQAAEERLELEKEQQKHVNTSGL